MVRVKQKKNKKYTVAGKRAINNIGTTVAPGIAHRKQAPRRKTINGVIESMSLDEMLEASSIATMCLRGVDIPVIKSDNVKVYVNQVSRLGKNPSTKKRAEVLVNTLNAKIVKKNIETSKRNNAKRGPVVSEVLSYK